MTESGSQPVVSRASADALEFPALLALVAELAETDAGRLALRDLEPAAALDELRRRRQLFEEASGLLSGARLVPAFGEPLLPLVARLEEGRSSIDGPDLLRLAAMARATREAATAIAAAVPEVPLLAAEAGALPDLRPLERRIASTLDRRGRVRDDASPELVRLGAQVRRVRGVIYKELQGFIGRHAAEVSEETVPLHEGRLVLKLRADAGARGRGLVHGRSGTGKSLYFEPLEVVESNNRLREALQEEEEERQRLLLELLVAARQSAPQFRRHLEFLAALDLLQAAHRFAEASGGRPVEIAARHDLVAVEARHPLLDPALAELRRRALGQPGHTDPVVPLDLELDRDQRILVITGPNAGGKTVALKTVGLLALAAQCGLPFPAAAGTRVPPFSRIVATVGDEQDLLADRSTFSGRLLRLDEAWRAAGPDALLLLDELGSGTDPEEGTALSVALLEGLIARRCLAVVTTHLTRLSAAALEREGAACGAMEFDVASSAPTYRLQRGAPAGSKALALASKLGLAAEWLRRAEELLGPEHRDLRRLLAEVEELRRNLSGELGEAERERAGLAQEQRRLERATAELEAEKIAVGRRSRRELEAFRRKVTAGLREELKEIRRQVEAGRKRGLAEAAAERLFREAPESELPEVEEEGAPPALGDRVEHRGLGWSGVLERLERGHAEVRVAGKRMRCRAEDLRRIEEPSPPRKAVRRGRARGSREAFEREEIAAEVNLIGRRVEEALEELDLYLDRALLSDHELVRVIHGHGSGRLRRAVRAHLKTHPAVAALRGGRPDEGGNGATVVSLRE